VKALSNTRLTRFFVERFPDSQSILGVYSVIVFLVYSWTLFTSFYKLPSWLFYLTVSQVFSIYAYTFSLNLIESILILALVLFLDLTLFAALRNKDEFQPRSIFLILVCLLSSMRRLVLFKEYKDTMSFLDSEFAWWILTIVFGVLSAVFAARFEWCKRFFRVVSDRMSVFLYIYIPLSLISFIVVLFRNLA
jgi:hypothetical protein